MSEETTEPTAPETVTERQGEPEQPLGENGEKALKSEREARKAAERSAAELKARLDEIEKANLSDLERAQQEAADAKSRLADLERQSLAQRIALEEGLHASLVDRLRGATEDEIRADAAALKQLVGQQPATPKPDASQGGASGSTTQTTADQFASAIEAAFTR